MTNKRVQTFSGFCCFLLAGVGVLLGYCVCCFLFVVVVVFGGVGVVVGLDFFLFFLGGWGVGVENVAEVLVGFISALLNSKAGMLHKHRACLETCVDFVLGKFVFSTTNNSTVCFSHFLSAEETYKCCSRMWHIYLSLCNCTFYFFEMLGNSRLFCTAKCVCFLQHYLPSIFIYSP